MPENDPKDGDKGTEGGKPEGGAGASTPEPKPITFKSQEELDAIIEARVARAKPKDYDELVALRDKVQEAEAKQKTDLERAREEAAQAKTTAQTATERANAVLRRAAILVEAAAQNAVDAETVALLLANSDSITVTDDGEVKGAKQAVKALIAEKPFLARGKAPDTSGGEFGGQEAKTLQQQIAAAEEKKDWKTALRLKAGLAVQGQTQQR